MERILSHESRQNPLMNVKPKTSNLKPNDNNRSVVVVGAGLGGMATAARLAHAGFHVEIWEKNQIAGGKLQEIRNVGFRWDTGPSLMTMPHVLEKLFRDLDVCVEDYLRLDRLHCTCRYFWSDGTVIDEDEKFWHRPEVARFMAHAGGIYELSKETFLRHPPEDFWQTFTVEHWPKLRHLPKVMTFRSMASAIDRYISDPHVRQIFYRYATYNGSSPYRAPAAFNIIPYVESAFGGWYANGGMRQIATALERLAREQGVTFRYETEPQSWNGRDLWSADGLVARPDYVICNGDVLTACETWLADVLPQETHQEWVRQELSSSGLVYLFGMNGRNPKWDHHNVIFSDDYPGEFDDVFGQQRLPEYPTLYLAITARTDSRDAPEGCDNYFILINAPSIRAERWNTQDVERFRDHVIDRLERIGGCEVRDRIAVAKTFTPADFAQRDASYQGALYGWASHTIRSSLLRPPIQCRTQPNLFFVGGTTHPGGGIPLVLLSAEMAARKILFHS